MRKTRVSKTLRLLIGGFVITALFAADGAFLCLAQAGYWYARVIGWLLVAGTALAIWWIRE